MNRTSLSTSSALLLVTVLLSSTSFADDNHSAVIPWEADKPLCVAWEADKRFMLVSDERPVGIACAGDLTIERESEKARCVVTVPIHRFRSEEKGRDDAVREVLSGNGAKTVQFKSDELSPAVWKELISQQSGKLRGSLIIANKRTPVTLEFRQHGSHFIGEVRTSFSELKLEAPSVGWGSIALVRDPLILHFKFVRDLLPSF